jgi:hypothetical protein
MQWWQRAGVVEKWRGQFIASLKPDQGYVRGIGF